MVGSLSEAPEKKDQPQGHCYGPSGKPRRPIQRIFSNQRGKYTYPAESGRYTSSLWDLTNRSKNDWARIDFEGQYCSYWLRKQKNGPARAFTTGFHSRFPLSPTGCQDSYSTHPFSPHSMSVDETFISHLVELRKNFHKAGR